MCVKQFTLCYGFREIAAVIFRAAGCVRISTDATMLLTDRVDQLHVHPDAMRVGKHATSQHVEQAEFLADLPDRRPHVPVGKGGGARTHKAARQRERYIGDNAVADPVHRVVLTRMLARGAGLSSSRTAGRARKE
jgi:hypothetical protein